MVATCEALPLAEKLGLESTQKFYDIASKASGQSWSLTSYCPLPRPVRPRQDPADRGYEGGFAAGLMLKDLKLAMAAAQGVDASVPLTPARRRGRAALRALCRGGPRRRRFLRGLSIFCAGPRTKRLELFPLQHSFRRQDAANRADQREDVPMRVSIRKTVSRGRCRARNGGGGRQRPRRRPRLNFTAAAAAFTAAASMAAALAAAAFTAAAGEAAAGMAAVGAARRLGPARMGRRRLGLAARRLGWLGWRLGRRMLELRLGRVGAGAMIQAGRSRRRPCRSGSRSRRSPPMAAGRVAGSGDASGRRTATIMGRRLVNICM